jgi:hypothetical protein
VEINFMTHEIGDQLEFCMGILENPSGFYEKADVAGKQQIIGSIFTGNLIFSENKVRTTKVNEVVSLLINSSKSFEKKKKGQPNKNLKLSPWVTRACNAFRQSDRREYSHPQCQRAKTAHNLDGIARYVRDPHERELHKTNDARNGYG